MTEEEWLALDETYRSWATLFTSTAGWLGPEDGPSRMADRLRALGSHRQVHLFGCACCRRLWLLLEDAGQSALDRVEDYADGRESLEAVERIMQEVDLVPHLGWPDRDQRIAARAVTALLSDEAAHHAAFAADDPAAERREQYRLLVDIFGRPQPPPAVDPGWLAWGGGSVPALAEAIYQERRFAELPVLADALEDAGCTDANMMDHCRSPGPHVRGCWVVDLILGRA